MSEEYIRIHKPGLLNDQVATNTPKTPRNSRRKSVSLSTKKNKRQSIVTPKENSDILNDVFNIFEEKIKKTKQEIHQDLFESTYDNIVQYFDYYAFKRAVCTSSITEQIVFNPVCNVIPTIALFTGINTQDYAYLCENLRARLEENFTQYIFFINEKNSANIKTLVNSIFSQWEAIGEPEERAIKRNLFTFRYFFECIKTENNSDSRSGSVIFFFKQFELIPKETIECFVSLISCHMESIPIYFIIELASQSNIIQEQLSSSVISKLCIKKLYLMSPDQYIDKFIEKLFIDDSVLFKISGDIFKFLIDIYHDYNYSISSFIHALKFCFFDHLQKNDLNSLFISNELENFDTFELLIQKLNQNDLNKTSIRSICKSLNENSISICIQQIQKKWQQFNNQFVLMCRMLYEIVKNFPVVQDDNLLYSNRSFIDLYEFCDLKKLLQLSSFNTINDIVSSFIKLIKTRCFNHESDFDSEFFNEIREFYELLEKMKQKFTIQNCDTSFNEDDEVLPANETDDVYDIDSKANQLEFMTDTSPKSLVSRKSSARTLKVISENSPSKHQTAVKTKNLTQQQKKIQSAKILNNFKQCMIDWLSEQFSIYFDNDYSTDLPFSNYFCYSDFDTMKKKLYDVQRLNMHECLLSSFSHLKLSDVLPENLSESPRKKMKNSRKSSGASPLTKVDFDSAFLPINIAYKIYLECGHLINLHDWLHAFVDRLENSGLDELKENRKKQLITITELQFMGYIKPTSRKVDHVIKLTNGSSLLAYE